MVESKLITPMRAATLTRDPLQSARVDAICYGAKDTGEMGGGAAAAILAAAGPDVLTDLRAKLASSGKRVGDVVVTPSYKLSGAGVRWIIHLISIIKHTPTGAYCPEPDRLRGGVSLAISSALQLGARSLAFAAMGTGEGRVEPAMAARLMLNGVRDFWQTAPKADMEISFCLPTYRDYEAFRAAASHSQS